MILKTKDIREQRELDLVVFSKDQLFLSQNEIQNVFTLYAFGHQLYWCNLQR